MTPFEHGPTTLFRVDRHEVDAFDCGVPELDDWLRRTAATSTAAGTAATWVLCDGTAVVGFYALAMGSIARADGPSRLVRGQPDPVPVLLLARLALDRSLQGTGLGSELLHDALGRGVTGARSFGARAIVVDAIDERAASFYRTHDFRPISGRRLYRRVSDIETSLGP